MNRGLTLAEVLISLALLSLVCGSVLVVYSSVLAATRKAPANQGALACLETVSRIFEQRVRETWPNPPAASMPVQGSFLTYTYQVEDFGQVINPLNVAERLQVKRIQITVEYPITGTDSSQSIGRYVSTVLVAR